jgi:hypothetical protein
MTIEIEAGASQSQCSMKLSVVHTFFRPALEWDRPRLVHSYGVQSVVGGAAWPIGVFSDGE